jgi:hypothetical protein
MNAKAKVALLLAASAISFAPTVWTKEDLPKTESFARYQPMLKHSPFAVATAGAPMPSSPDFAKDLYVANAAHSIDGDFVTLASTTNKDLKEYLNTKETIHGYSISNIQWSNQVGETKVTIAKNGQFATLTFNEALLSQAIHNPAPPPPQPVPGTATQPPNPRQPIQRPMPVPQIPTPPPHTRPVIRRQGVPGQPLNRQQQMQQQMQQRQQLIQHYQQGGDDQEPETP